MKTTGTAPRVQRGRQLHTEEAFARAAISLASEAGGLEKVTVDEIAAEAGMARRTFFNRFSAKEEALLWPLRQISRHLFRTFRESPEDADVWVALEAATIDAIQANEQHVDLAARADRVIESSSWLLGLELLGPDPQSHFEEIVRRSGTDADRDALPHLIGTTSYGILRIALRLWRSEQTPPRATVVSSFARLRPSFSPLKSSAA